METTEATRVCNTCGRELPATEQYFYRWKYGRDGLKSSCKECQGGNFILKEKPPAGYRKCHDCGQILPETEEYFLRYWSKRDSKYRYKCHCIECGKTRSKRWREEKPELYKAYYKEYQQTERARESKSKFRANHKEEIAEYKQRYRATHKAQIAEYDRSRRETPEGKEHANAMTRRWRAGNKEAVAEYNKRYEREHLDYFIQAGHKRNALKKKLPYTLTLEEWEAIKAEFSYCCAYCGKPLKHFTQDHFIPLSAGGGYTRDNIIPACRRCNSSKHTSSFTEWYRKQSYYSPERETRILSYLERARGGDDGA